ncbi:MAG: hypothetical protein J6A55_04535 [Oscillospiraceae bacterium]|nr:hypothetical protein [Oscillospiraceae bacterium]
MARYTTEVLCQIGDASRFELDTDKMRDASTALYTYIESITGMFKDAHLEVHKFQSTFKGREADLFDYLWEGEGMVNIRLEQYMKNLNKYASYFHYAACKYELFAENAVARAKTIFGK